MEDKDIEDWPRPTPDVRTEFYLMLATSMFGLFLIVFLLIFK